MSFTPGSALYPALHLALLLKTKKHCCYKHFSPQSRHFQPQTLQQRVPRLCSDERRRPWGFIFDGLQHGNALVAPQEDLPTRMGGRKEKHPQSGACGGPPQTGRDGTGLLALPGAPLAPDHPTQSPAGHSPAPQPYLCPFFFHALIKQKGFSLRLHCKRGNCFCHCSPKGCTFLRQLDLYRALCCRDKVC